MSKKRKVPSSSLEEEEQEQTSPPQKRVKPSSTNKPLVLNLPIELFDAILAYLPQSFVTQTFSLVCATFLEVATDENIWTKRVFSISKRETNVNLKFISVSRHVQISHPKFHLFSFLYFSKPLTTLELSNLRLSVSQLAFVILTNSQLVNISLSNLEISPIEDSFATLCRKFSDLLNCTIIKWNHVHLSNVQTSNSILSNVLAKCPHLETLHFATQNCANLETAQIIFQNKKLRNLSLFGIDEISLEEFFNLYGKHQWNSLNLQSCRRICNRELLMEFCVAKATSCLRELTIRFEPSDGVSNLSVVTANTDESPPPNSLGNLHFLRLQNIDPSMVGLVTDIIYQCSRTIQTLSLHINNEFDEAVHTNPKLFHLSSTVAYPCLKQLSTSNLPFRICSSFQSPNTSLEKIMVFGIGEKLDHYSRVPMRQLSWETVRILFLENVGFARTKNLTSFIFSIPNLEILKFSYVNCESSSSPKLVPSETPKTKLIDLEIQDSILSAEFYYTIFSASPDLKHLKLSNMESDHAVVSYRYGKFFEHMANSCRRLATITLDMRGCPCLKNLSKTQTLPRIQQVSILDIPKVRFDEALIFILSIANANQVNLFIDQNQMMEGSFYFFKDVRSFYEHLFSANNMSVDFFSTRGNFAKFVLTIIRDRLDFALPYVRFSSDQEQRQQEAKRIRKIFDNLDSLRTVSSFWQFYLFCGMSLALINPTLKSCCERDLEIHMDWFNWAPI